MFGEVNKVGNKGMCNLYDMINIEFKAMLGYLGKITTFNNVDLELRNKSNLEKAHKKVVKATYKIFSSQIKE